MVSAHNPSRNSTTKKIDNKLSTLFVYILFHITPVLCFRFLYAIQTKEP